MCRRIIIYFSGTTSFNDSVKYFSPHCRALQYAISVLQSSCPGHRDNCVYLLVSNKMAALVDLSLQLLSEVLPSSGREGEAGLSGSKVTSVCGGLLRVLAGVVSTLAAELPQELCQHLVDLVRYVGAYSNDVIRIHIPNFKL